MKQTFIIILVGVLIAAAAYFFIMKKKTVKSVEEPPAPARPDGIIYGVMTCPHTVKQVEKYPDYKFVDCSTNACPTDIVKAYPTTVHPDGNVEVGTKA